MGVDGLYWVRVAVVTVMHFEDDALNCTNSYGTIAVDVPSTAKVGL